MAPDHGDVVKQGLALKKAGNELMSARRRPRGSPDQRPRRRLLQGADRSATWSSRRGAEARARHRRRDRALGRKFDFPDCSATTSWSRSAIRTNIRSTRGGSSPTAVSTSPRANIDAAFRGACTSPHSNALQSRRRDGARHLSRRSARPLRPQFRAACRRCARRRRQGGGPGPDLPQSLSEHHRPRGGTAFTPATRRCASSTPTSSRTRPSSRSSRAPARLRRDRGAARLALSPLPARRRRHDPGCRDRPAHLAEPGDDRGGPHHLHRRLARSARRGTRACAANRRCATTTHASPARPTSSTSASIGGEEVTAAAFHCEALRQVRARAVKLARIPRRDATLPLGAGLSNMEPAIIEAEAEGATKRAIRGRVPLPKGGGQEGVGAASRCSSNGRRCPACFGFSLMRGVQWL